MNKTRKRTKLREFPYGKHWRRNRLKHRIRDYLAGEPQSPGKRIKPVKTAPRTIPINEVELVASICRESFFEFVKEFWDVVVPEKPVWNWHIEYLCNEMQVMAERIFKMEKKNYDLVVNIAPGTTKSLIMSVMFPMWCWTRMRSFRFIGASYSLPLAMDLSVLSRDVLRSDKYRSCFPEIVVREDQDTKTFFKIHGGGFRVAVGVNGAITGKHSHAIVIDDPLNPQEALSTADMASANHWIKHTLSNRKVDKAVSATMLVMQRLNQDDPTAAFLKQARIRHICLPAIIEFGEKSNVKPEELENKYVDGYMDPIRMGKDVLKEEKQKGEYYFSSQFLQSPVPAGGGMFKCKRIKVGTPPDKYRSLVRFWDKAGTKGGGDWTVGTKIGLDLDGRFWVLDVIRVQMDSFERESLIERTAQLDGSRVIIGIEQEPGSGGKESAESTARRLAGFKVRIVKASGTEGGKIERADPFSVQVNAGNVYLPSWMWDGGNEIGEWIEWAFEWIEEMRYFPYSKHDDQVDSAGGAFNLCAKKKTRIGGMTASREYRNVANTESSSVMRYVDEDTKKKVAEFHKRPKVYQLGYGRR